MNWKGGKRKFTNGYLGVWDREKQTYELEHRVIMRNSLGRDLNKGEHVHHINGDKTDNRIENLELIDISKHTTRHKTGGKLSEETKKKIGRANKRSIKKLWQNPEYRKHMSEAHKGQPSPMKGKKHSKKTKVKLSKSLKKYYEDGGKAWNEGMKGYTNSGSFKRGYDKRRRNNVTLG